MTTSTQSKIETHFEEQGSLPPPKLMGRVARLLLGLWLGWGAPGAWLGLTVEIGVLALITGWRVAGIRTGRLGRLDLLLG